MPQLAFPGAEGFGAYTVGGRFSLPNCYLITTNEDNDNAPVEVGLRTFTSSWRAAFHANVPRFIVPLIGGTCTLTISDGVGAGAYPSIAIDNPYCTVLGGMAPGGGCAIKGIFYNRADQVICQHVRFFMDENWGVTDNGKNCWSSLFSDQVIFDHCTSRWCLDNSPGIGESYNTTFSNLLIGPPLNNSGQARGPLIYGDGISFLRSVLYGCYDRTPSMGGWGPGGKTEVLFNTIVDLNLSSRTKQYAIYGPCHANVYGNSHYWFDGTGDTVPQYDYQKPFIIQDHPTWASQSSIYFNDNYDQIWRPTGAESQTENVYQQAAPTAVTILGSAIDFSSGNYVKPTDTASADAHAANIDPLTGAGAWKVRDANANFAVARDRSDLILIDNLSYSPLIRNVFYPVARAFVDQITDHDPQGVPPLADGLVGGVLPSAFDGSLANGGVPSAYTLPAGAVWSDIRDDGYNFLEGLAYQRTRYWDDEPVNLPNNIALTPFVVVPGTYTVLGGLSVEAADENITTVDFTQSSPNASVQVSDESGVDLDVVP